MTKEQAYKKVAELVDRFAEQYDSYRKSEYNETLTRRDFIDPFFKALGWDMDNTGGYAEEYREVVHEHKIMMRPNVEMICGKARRAIFIRWQSHFFITAVNIFLRKIHSKVVNCQQN